MSKAIGRRSTQIVPRQESFLDQKLNLVGVLVNKELSLASAWNSVRDTERSASSAFICGCFLENLIE